MKLIKNINVYAPEHLGSKDVLIIGDKIAKIEEAGCMPEIPYLTAEDIIDGSGKILTPGFIDCHVHILGGGGEGGFANRTKHCEAVLLLSKLNVDHHIEVEVSMDELDVTAAESKATYNEIREHVWEHHQLKVSNLYIAQVKQKHGIIERENYNKPKSENAKQPKCPKEKEAAIVEALRHFQMI